MRISGIGTDLVLLSRIKSLIDRFGDRFIQRILSADEQKVYQRTNQPIAFMAKRFAAKEAVAKALGTGIGKAVSFKQISVTNDLSGKPMVSLLEQAADLLHNAEIMISLADEKEHALAYVIIVTQA